MIRRWIATIFFLLSLVLKTFFLFHQQKELHRNGKSTSIYHDSWNARLNNNYKEEISGIRDVRKVSKCLMVEFMVRHGMAECNQKWKWPATKKTRCCYKIIMNRVSAWWWQKREFLRCYTTCRLHVQTLFSGGEWEERDECKLIAWFELLFDFWNDELKNSFFPAFRRALPVFQFSFSCYIKKWFFLFSHTSR